MLRRPLFTLVPLAALAGGCSLINAFDDVLPAGGGGAGNQGAGGTGAAGGTGGAGGATGGGGSGGEAPTYACTPFGSPVDILTKADLSSSTNVQEDVMVVFEGDGDGYVHLLATDNDARQIVGRTVRDDSLGPLVKYPAVPMSVDIRGFQAFATNDEVLVLANIDNEFQVIRFPKSGNELGTDPPTLETVVVPAACDGSSQQQRLRGVMDNGNLHLLGVCELNNGNALVFGTHHDAGSVSFTFAGPADDPQFRPSNYQRVGPAHVIVTNGENPSDPTYGAFLRVGDDTQVTQPGVPLQLAGGADTFPFAVVPGVGSPPSIFALIAGLSGDSPSLTPATLYSGVVEGAEIPAFAAAPNDFLQPALEFPNQAAITFITPPNIAFNQLTSAGITIFNPTSSGVYIQWWSPDGALVTNDLVDEIQDPSTNGRHTYAAAGQGNMLHYYVVYMVEDGDGQFFARGQRMTCDQVVR